MWATTHALVSRVLEAELESIRTRIGAAHLPDARVEIMDGGDWICLMLSSSGPVEAELSVYRNDRNLSLSYFVKGSKEDNRLFEGPRPKDEERVKFFIEQFVLLVTDPEYRKRVKDCGR